MLLVPHGETSGTVDIWFFLSGLESIFIVSASLWIFKILLNQKLRTFVKRIGQLGTTFSFIIKTSL